MLLVQLDGRRLCPQTPRPHPANRDPDTPRSSGSSLMANSERPRAQSHRALVRREAGLASGGRCWASIHSACSASLSHSRPRSS